MVEQHQIQDKFPQDLLLLLLVEKYQELITAFLLREPLPLTLERVAEEGEEAVEMDLASAIFSAVLIYNRSFTKDQLEQDSSDLLVVLLAETMVHTGVHLQAALVVLLQD